MMLIMRVQIMIVIDKRRDGDDDQHHAAVTRPKRKPLSAQKTQTAKRGATRATKT